MEQSNNAAKQKLIIAGVVIVLCTAWILYQIIPWGGTEQTLAPDTPISRFMSEARKVHTEPRFEYVMFEASEDGTAATISGKVASASDLSDLKAKFDEIAAANPGVTMKFAVTVGRIP